MLGHSARWAVRKPLDSGLSFCGIRFGKSARDPPGNPQSLEGLDLGEYRKWSVGPTSPCGVFKYRPLVGDGSLENFPFSMGNCATTKYPIQHHGPMCVRVKLGYPEKRLLI